MERGFPLTWSASENVRWQIALPAAGNSTPVVSGRRVFVTCANREGNLRSLMCLERHSGATLWERHVEVDQEELTHANNPYCSASPVTDGQQVVVWHGAAGLFAYDMDGVLLWHQKWEDVEHIWGTGSSPIIYRHAVILSAGPGVRSCLVALDKNTGQELWRRELPGMSAGRPDEQRGSWSTPLIVSHDGRDILLVSLPLHLYALDPLDGTVLWCCGGLGKLIYSSPVTSADVVVALSGQQGPAMAVRMGGQGDVTTTHRLWIHDPPTPQRVGSGVVVEDCFYILNESGVAWCLELLTGEVLWKHRVSDASSWSSMCYVEGRIYVTDRGGTTYVLQPADTECVVLAKNTINERMGASLAFSEGQIFLRTHQRLYCIQQNP